ncbi:toluene tolerance protein [Vibrio breoganii]|uniref:phospholipid-binding protein MlaC n=1 Tax=Vibrio breoganii TaxID=553239 RepID=UPI000C85FFD6|nr:phospholipid-binding protein MlaC [Vibrio breoganii]PMG79761.1 toluene tolerance protein [Vibrio breoganii]
MKCILRFISLILMLCSPIVWGATIDKTQPYQMMEQVGSNTFDRLKNEQAQLRESPDQLKVVVEEELMPYVNDRYAGLKVLGSYLKKADKAEVADFLVAFREYLVTSYAQVLTQYKDQQINYSKSKPIRADQRIVSIPVEIVQGDRPPIKIEFKWRKDKKTGEWQAFDMVAEGVSLISSKQSEWGGKIRSDGLPAVTEELARLAKTPIRYEPAK